MSAPVRTSILLAIDITGSVSLHQRVDEHEAQRALDRCLTRVHRSIQAHQGEILEQQGDELICRLDGTDNAIRCAQEMQARIADLPPVSGHKLSIRIALLDIGDNASPSALSAENRRAILGLVAQAQADQLVCCNQIAQGCAQGKEYACCELSATAPKDTPADSVRGFQLLAPGGHEHHRTIAHTQGPSIPERLCIRHRGKALLIDEKSPILSIGRDASCVLLIDDRKVSRHHARIERRADGYYLVDSSTNGSFLTLDGRPEILVRQDECLLQGSGQICFGGSANDWAAERIEFEGL